MMSLFPPSASNTIDVFDAVLKEKRTPHKNRPWVLSNMIESANLDFAAGTTSKFLGSEGDQKILRAYRAVSDVILVGAETVRKEKYKVPSERPKASTNFLSARPLLVVVSKSLDLLPDLAIFENQNYKPIIATTQNSPKLPARIEANSEIVRFGHDLVDLHQLLEYLAQIGAKTVVTEGGPTLNQQLANQDLIDEWNLTISPLLTKPANATRVLQPNELAAERQHALDQNILNQVQTTNMSLNRIWEEEGYLFCRWLKDHEE